ncbi:hypothetical protein F0562_003227 [Nyssa sinensis]|uniref:ATPase AAA-type core domain-containing protein n=1 Tax=Nyssa sinensis TaxID=561372 RepID=A0A5J5BVH0_9ASTE|nr:hypothetical protein F0562_003227 [Nyssa sinensis]
MIRGVGTSFLSFYFLKSFNINSNTWFSGSTVSRLAQRIVKGSVPEPVLNKKMISLNIVSLISGAMYIGDLEERMEAILEEISAAKGQIILFIDEIHTIVGAVLLLNWKKADYKIYKSENQFTEYLSIP